MSKRVKTSDGRGDNQNGNSNAFFRTSRNTAGQWDDIDSLGTCFVGYQMKTEFTDTGFKR